MLPIIDYGSIVYSSAKDHVINKLNPVHHSGIRIVTGALRSSPVLSLYIESGIPPLTIRRSKLLLNYAAKIIALPRNPMFKVLFKDVISEVRVYGKKPLPLAVRLKQIQPFYNTLTEANVTPYTPCLPPWSSDMPRIDISLSQNKKTVTSPVVYKAHFNELVNSKYHNHSLCFSDGSKSAESTSCAFSINGVVSSSSLNTLNSIFSAELLAC